MKRDLFAELKEGFQELEAQRQGKLTLRGQEARLAPVAAIDAGDLLALRERLNLSRAVFAMYLPPTPRPLEKGEGAPARPNAQAATLIRLIERYPDTLERLAGL